MRFSPGSSPPIIASLTWTSFRFSFGIWKHLLPTAAKTYVRCIMHLAYPSTRLLIPGAASLGRFFNTKLERPDAWVCICTSGPTWPSSITRTQPDHVEGPGMKLYYSLRVHRRWKIDESNRNEEDNGDRLPLDRDSAQCIR